MNHTPDKNQIENLLTNIKLSPGDRFYRRMAAAPWEQTGLRNPRLRVALAAAFAVVLFVVFLAVTPQGRAIAQELLGFFSTTTQTSFPATPGIGTPVPTTLIPVEEVQSISAVNPEQCGPTISPVSSTFLCQLVAAEAEAGFEVKAFPANQLNLIFQSLNVDPLSRTITLYFEDEHHTNFWLIQGQGDFTLAMEPWELVPNDAIRQVQVSGQSAEYLQGDYVLEDDSQTYTWSPDIGGPQRLRWKDGDRWFEIRKHGIPEESQPLNGEDLIVLAENLVTQAQGVEQLAGADSPTLEQRTGFGVVEPTILPKGYFFCSGSYGDYDGGVLYLSYCSGGGTQLSITQVPVDNGLGYDFAERWGGDVTVTPIQIGDISGNYASRPDGRQGLMWETDGVRIIIDYFWGQYVDDGKRLDQAGLLAIAEGMR